MSWKGKLREIRNLARFQSQALRERLREEKNLQKEIESQNFRISNQVERIVRKFGKEANWEYLTDASTSFSLKSKFYLQPKEFSFKDYFEQRIIIEISYQERKIKVKTPSFEVKTIEFSDFKPEALIEGIKEAFEGIPVPKSEPSFEIPFEDQQIPGTLALGWYWNQEKEKFQMARIKEEDRATHLYLIGATGTGKTKFLEFLIKQDIEKGNGFGVIDPHGDLIEDVKDFLACHYYLHQEKELLDQVILIDPTDPDYTLSFNPLEELPGVSVSQQVSELISSFKKIWQDSWGVRMEDLLRNSLIALAEAGLTLIELPKFLTSKAFRERILEKVTHPIAREYFARFDLMTERAQISWIEPVMNKINAFLADQRLREIFASPKSSFNFREVMDQGKILLVKLDKGRLKDSADLLGSLILAKLQLAAFSRSELPPQKRKPFYLYIDEFQNFATESFAILLSEARKYGLSLILAHQTLSQIPDELRGTILGNTGLQVYFRLNRQDSQLLAKEAFEYSGYEIKTFKGLSPVFWSLGEEWEEYISQLQSLPPRCCYIKHKIEGGILPIQTVEIEPGWQVLGMEENEYQAFLKGLSFGRKYLLSRKEVRALAEERLASLREEELAKPVLEERPKKKEAIPVAQPELVPLAEQREEGQHRYLQNLIKRMAEEKGYRAIIEEALPDGRKVDVGLEINGRKIACEISLTSSSEQELSNIRKCLEAGYDKVILCSPERKNLEKVRALVSEEFQDSEKGKILFFQPDELISYLEAEAVNLKTEPKRIKGYKVKVSYQPVAESEKRAKREVISQVILSALNRLKKGG
jgi:hypothetical protein